VTFGLSGRSAIVTGRSRGIGRALALGDRMLAVNVKGVWNASRAVVPHMQRHGYGKMVNISSSTIFPDRRSCCTTSPRRVRSLR
jgi:NAD(P)-dependent dehydrogenase (short-subunit alcohol dehydrogenase family)